MDQLFAYMIAAFIALGFIRSAGSSIPAGQQQSALVQETNALVNLGSGYQSDCMQHDFVCSGLQTGDNAAVVVSGFVVAIPSPTLNGGSYDTVVAADAENSTQQTVFTYATAPVDGELLGNMPVYSVTAAGVVANNGRPGTATAGTSYYLVYDKCLSGIYASATQPQFSACP